jgi:thiaminase/transcriptional activator TenA
MPALSTCVVGNAEIARNGAELPEANPYTEWIGEYAGQRYQDLVMDARGYLNDLGLRYLTPTRFEQLVSSFRSGVTS